ncbi:transporter substrate-binding domain-containing protein [Streptomyces diacarni]|uniref:substrate-binding periplasmic protein n=1 Tax=Streptomyces diacarni TaxID=2800381 RepID=UPI0033E8151A
MKSYFKPAALGIIAILAMSACSSTPPGAADSVSDDCQPLHQDLKTLEEGVLTVAQYEYVPFSMSEGPGTLTGLEGDVLTRFAELECLDLKINKGDSAAMITSVATGRADTTLGSWYRTEQRAQKVRLSAPIVTSPLSSITKEGAETVDDLTEMSIGVGQGLIGVDELKEIFGGSLKIYQNDDAVYEDIKSGRIDGSVQGYIAGNEYLKKHGIQGFKVVPLEVDSRLTSTKAAGQTNFPVSKDNSQLGTAIDEVIAQMRESGELDEIAEKYGLDTQIMHPGEPNLL